MIFILRVNLDFDPKRPESRRLSEAIDSIRQFSRFDRVLVLSHRGQPEDRETDLSLSPFAKILSRRLRRPVIFLPRFSFGEIRRKIRTAGPTAIFLLENLRFLNGERKNSSSLSRELASLGDIYINDDFATSHRLNASVSGIAAFLPAFPGKHLFAELKNLEAVAAKNLRPRLLVVGGAKAEDKIGHLGRLLPKFDSILLGGLTANVFLNVAGRFKTHRTISVKTVRAARDLLKKYRRKIILPQDWVLRPDGEIGDIGPRTIRDYAARIKKAKAVVWAGPMGIFEKEKYRPGTTKIARAIGNNPHFSIIGGGDTLRAVGKTAIKRKTNHLSVGGGAMLAYLAGEPLPGITALIKSANDENRK
jgi:phosphoglycerate kinase